MGSLLSVLLMPLICLKLLLEFTPQILDQLGLAKQCSPGARLLSTLCGPPFHRGALSVPLWVQHRKSLLHGTNIKLLLKLLYVVRSRIFTFSGITLSSLTALQHPSASPRSGLLFFLPQVLHTYLIGLFVANLFLLQPVLDDKLMLLKHSSGAATLH